MKFKVDVECTPEEARLFIGLPNIVPMQEKMMKELEDQMLENIRTLDAETLAKTWFPTAMQNIGEMQKMFWSQMGVNTSSARDNAPGDEKK